MNLNRIADRIALINKVEKVAYMPFYDEQVRLYFRIKLGNNDAGYLVEVNEIDRLASQLKEATNQSLKKITQEMPEAEEHFKDIKDFVYIDTSDGEVSLHQNFYLSFDDINDAKKFLKFLRGISFRIREA